MYALTQSARDWDLLLRSQFLSWGFVQSLADPSLSSTKKRKSLTALVYVDAMYDIAISSKAIENLKWFADALLSGFNSKDLGEIEKFLGMRITRDRRKNTIYIYLEQYLKKVLRKFDFPKPMHKMQKIPIDGYDALRPAKENDN